MRTTPSTSAANCASPSDNASRVACTARHAPRRRASTAAAAAAASRRDIPRAGYAGEALVVDDGLLWERDPWAGDGDEEWPFLAVEEDGSNNHATLKWLRANYPVIQTGTWAGLITVVSAVRVQFPECGLCAPTKKELRADWALADLLGGVDGVLELLARKQQHRQQEQRRAALWAMSARWAKDRVKNDDMPF
jgi:hypothetical protein